MAFRVFASLAGDTLVSLEMRTELVSTLRRRATEIIADLGAARDPVLITHHGRPAAYLVDVETYEKTQRRLTILEGIACGEGAVEEGRVLGHSQAKKRMARWLRRFSVRIASE